MGHRSLTTCSIAFVSSGFVCLLTANQPCLRLSRHRRILVHVNPFLPATQRLRCEKYRLDHLLGSGHFWAHGVCLPWDRGYVEALVPHRLADALKFVTASVAAAVTPPPPASKALAGVEADKA